MITNNNYYRALAIMDRVESIREEKNITKCYIGKILGYTKPWYHSAYNSFRTLKISTLIKFAEVLDVSVEYLLTGKNKKDYKPFNVNYDLLFQQKKRGIPIHLRPIKTQIKKGRTKSITIKTLFEFEEFYKIPAIKLIGGE